MRRTLGLELFVAATNLPKDLLKTIKQTFCSHRKSWARAVFYEKYLNRRRKKYSFAYEQLGHIVYCPNCKKTFFGPDNDTEDMRYE